MNVWMPCSLPLILWIFQELPVTLRLTSLFLFRVSLSDGSDSESSSASSPLHHDPPPPLLKASNNQVSFRVCTAHDSAELKVCQAFCPLNFKQSPS